MARGRPAVCSVGGGTRTCTLGSLGETLVDHDELVRLVSIFVDGQAGRRVFETLQTPIDAGRRLHQHHAGVVVGTASVSARSALGSWRAPASRNAVSRRARTIGRATQPWSRRAVRRVLALGGEMFGMLFSARRGERCGRSAL